MARTPSRYSRCVSSLVDSPPVCSLCETSVGVHSRCLECQECLCENCRKVHSRGKATRSHKIVHICGVRETMPFTKFVQCCAHPSSEVIMYCKKCDLLVCSQCISSTHTGHVFEQIDSVYESKVDDLENTLEILENDSMTTISMQVKKAKFKRRHKRSEIEFLKERITQLTEVQKKVLEKRRDDLLDELDRHYTQSEDHLLKAELEFELTKSDLHDCQQTIQKSLATCERIGVIRTANTIKTRMADLELTKSAPVIETPNFEKNDLDENTCLGALTFSLTNIGTDSVYEMINGVKIETSVAGVMDTGFRFISSVCQISGGYSWIACSSSDFITLVNHSDDLQEVSQLDITADDIAYLSSDTILISSPDENYVHKVSTVDGVSEIFLDVSPLFPTGIHVTNKKDILLSIVEGHRYSFKVDSQRKVVRFSSDKNIKSEYQFAGTKRLFTYPYRLCQNTNSDVCVVDKAGAFTGRLVVLDQSGSLRFTFTGGSSADQKSTFDPRDVVCDSLGRIITSDCGNHIIHVLDHDGDIVCHISTLKLGVRYPWSLSFESYVKLWIGCKAEPEKSDSAKLYVVETVVDQG